MKYPGPELGNLSSRFFAYVQLKKRDTVRTGELGSVLGLTESQERDLLRRLSNSGWIVRLKRGVYFHVDMQGRKAFVVFDDKLYKGGHSKVSKS